VSLTAALWLVAYIGGLLASFAHPAFGFLTYIFEYYVRPSENWWGRAIPFSRTSLVAGAVFGLTLLLHRSSLRKLLPSFNLAMPFAILMALNVPIVSLWAVDANLNARWGMTLLDHLMIYFLIIGVVRQILLFDAFAMLHMAGAAWWGFGAIGARRQAGRLEGVGSSDSMGANPGAMQLLTVLPFILVYMLTGNNQRLRIVAMVAFPLVVNLFVLFNSRGAVLGLCFAAAAALVLVKGTTRLKALAGAAVVAGAIFALADPQFIARQQSTATAAEDDNSAMTRLESWKQALRLIADHPFGTGGRGFHVLSPQYIPNIVARAGGEGRSVHNTYLQIAAEWGLQGLVFYLGFIGSTLWMLHRMHYKCPRDNPWFYRAIALETALLGSMVAAVFGDRLYGESIYWLCALSYAAKRTFETDLAEAAEQLPAPEPKVVDFRPTFQHTPIRTRLAKRAGG
jgi:O-antigen ligase